MKLILIESTVYRASEKVYAEIINKKEEIDSKGYYNGNDVDMLDFLETKLSFLKEVGTIDFDFRL